MREDLEALRLLLIWSKYAKDSGHAETKSSRALDTPSKLLDFCNRWMPSADGCHQALVQHATGTKASHRCSTWPLGHPAWVHCPTQALTQACMQLRRGIEGLPAKQVERMTYYEKWAASAAEILLERQIITRRDLDAALGVPEVQQAPR